MTRWFNRCWRDLRWLFCSTDVIVPMPYSDGASVQPVLKGVLVPPKHRLWTTPRRMHRCPFLDRRFNRCHWDFLTWYSCALSNAPMPVRRFIRWLLIRPVQRHRLNRCYLSLLCLSNPSRRWIEHISTTNWTHWISFIEPRKLQIWSHKLVSPINYVVTPSPESQTMA